MNKKLLRYLGGMGALSMGGFILYVLFTTLLFTYPNTDFSKIMRIVDIMLFICVASMSIGIGIGCFKEEIFHEQPLKPEVDSKPMNQESISILKQVGQISIGVLVIMIPFSIIYFGYSSPHWEEEKTKYKQMTCTQLADTILNEKYDKWAVDSQYLSNIYGVKCK